MGAEDDSGSKSSTSPTGTRKTSSTSKTSSGTTYLYTVDYGDDKPTVVVKGTEADVQAGKGEVIAMSEGPGGDPETSMTLQRVVSSSISRTRSGQVSIVSKEGEVVQTIKGERRLDIETGRIYDPSADRIIQNLVRGKPDITPEEIEAYTARPDSAVMGVDREYAAAYFASQTSKIPAGRAGAALAAERTAVPAKLAGVKKWKLKASRFSVIGPSADTMSFEARATPKAKPVGEDYEITVPKVRPIKQEELTEEYFVSQARLRNPFRDVFMFGELSTSMAAGLDIIRHKTFYEKLDEKTSVIDKSKVTWESGLLHVGGAAGVGFVSGAAAGYTGGALAVGGKAAVVPVALKLGQSAATTTAFQTGIGATLEAKRSIDEKEAFSLERVGFKQIFDPKNIAQMTFVGLGATSVGIAAAPAIGKATGSAAAQVIGTGAASGAYAGTAVGVLSPEKKKPIAESAVVGGVIGGATAAAGYGLEKKGIKPVAETTRVDIVSPSGKIEQKITGAKVGLEIVDPKTGEMKFYGKALAKDVKVPEGSTLRPTGVYETLKYGSPALQKQYAAEHRQILGQETKISATQLEKGLKQATGPEYEKVGKAIKETGGTLAGSKVEKALYGKGGLVADQPSVRVSKKSDIDVVYYGTDKGAHQLAGKLGVTGLKESPQPLAYKGYPATASKYEFTTPGGTKFDVSVVRGTPFDPRPATPMGQYGGTFTFGKAGGYTTYSPSQQIATKYMTIGQTSTGKVATIEPTKTKYLQDIRALQEAAGEKPTTTATIVKAAAPPAPVSAPISAPSPPPSPPPSAPSRPSSLMSPVSVAPSSPISSPPSTPSSVPSSVISAPVSPPSPPPSSPTPSVSTTISAPSSAPSVPSSSPSSPSSPVSPSISPSSLFSGFAFSPVMGPSIMPTSTLPTDRGKAKVKGKKVKASAKVRDLFSSMVRLRARPVGKAKKRKPPRLW